MMNDVKLRMNQAFERIKKATELTNYNVSNVNIWEWWSGVCLYGIIRADESKPDRKYKEFLADWLENNTCDKRSGSVNRVIPVCAALYMYELTEEEKYKALCDEYADWCLHKALRAENGGYAHVWGPNSAGVELGSPDYQHQIWADTLMMAVVFLIRYGADFKKEELVKEALSQIKIHIEDTWDDAVSLCYHAYDCRTKEKLGLFWGRGNGWIAVTLAELLRVVPDADDYYKNKFKRMMESAYAKRAGDGMLHTLLNVETSYCEATASMLFGYAACIGAQCGVLDSRFKDWAEQIADNLSFNEEGAVLYASGGTGPDKQEVYENIKFEESAYSNGLVLLLYSSLEGK